MANTYTLNTNKWYQTQAGCDVVFGRSYDGGVNLIEPFRREQLPEDSTYYVHFFDVANKGVTTNDVWYVCGQNGRFTGIELYNSSWFSPVISDSHTLIWEYWNGSTWLELPNLIDETNGLTEVGRITWDLPSDWTAYNYIDENDHNYPGFYIRARLATVSNITDGGKIFYSYVKIRPYTIIVEGNDDYSAIDVYNADQNNGWGLTEKVENTYVFKAGWINDTDNASIRFLSYSDTRADHYQFGTANEPCFYMKGVFRQLKSVYVNYSDTQTSYVSRKHMHLTFYTSWIPVSHNFDYIALGSASKTNKSIYNNVSLQIMSHYGNLATHDIYNPYFPVYRFMLVWWAEFRQCNFETTRKTGGVVTEYFTQFWRCNLSEIQYISTDNYQANYDNCLVVNYFSIDPGREVIFTDSEFANLGDENTQFYGRYTPYSYVNSHYLELRDCQWRNGNNYVKSSSFNIYPDKNLYLITVWTHVLNIKVVDKNGNPITNATVTVKDRWGNPQLRRRMKDCWVVYDSSKYDPILVADDTDDHMPMSIATSSKFSVGDYMYIMGEVLKIKDFSQISATKTMVYFNRRQLKTSFHQNRRTYYSDTGNDANNESRGVYKIFSSVQTDSNGETGEYIITERRQHRQGDINTYEEIIFNPYTIEISVNGYKKYIWQGEITSKLNWEISLEQAEVSVDQEVLL